MNCFSGKIASCGRRGGYSSGGDVLIQPLSPLPPLQATIEATNTAMENQEFISGPVDSWLAAFTEWTSTSDLYRLRTPVFLCLHFCVYLFFFWTYTNYLLSVCRAKDQTFSRVSHPRVPSPTALACFFFAWMLF